MKEFTLRELTKRGCARREEKDFRDDGTKFKMVQYKDLLISYTKYEGEYFLSIRIDYYERHLQYQDIPSELFKLADEFNGCYDIDPDKVIENCETISKGLAEAEEKLEKELPVKPDTTPLKEQAIKEINLAKEIIEKFKASEVIYKLETRYEAGSALNHLHSLEEDIEDLASKEWDQLDKYEIRDKLNEIKEYGYLKISKDNYDIKQLIKYIKGNK